MCIVDLFTSRNPPSLSSLSLPLRTIAACCRCAPPADTAIFAVACATPLERSPMMSTLRRCKRASLRRRGAALLLAALAMPAISDQTLPNESPASFTPRVESFDYTEREVMIPMRDGVKLQTVILIPRAARRAPILLTRTPYGATSRIARHAGAHLAAVIDSSDAADDAVLNGGYIRVMQDVRGKHGSGSQYDMTRAPQRPVDPQRLQPSTDHHRPPDWLVKNLPE